MSDLMSNTTGGLTRSTLSRRSLLALGGAIGVGGALSLAGCGGSSGDSNSADVINTGSNDTLILQQLMDDMGYMHEQGITAKTTNVSSGSDLMGSIIGGKSDIAILTGFSQIFPAIEKGADLKLLGAVSLIPGDAIYSAKPDIHSVKDLRGKSVGTGQVGALLSELFLAAFQKEGVDPKSVTFVNIGSSTDVFKAVSAGKVDAGIGYVSYYDQQDKYGVHAIADLWNMLPRFTLQGPFASAKTIDSKGDELAKVLAAYLHTFRYASSKASKDDYLKAALKVPGEDEATATTLWNFYQDHHFFSQDLQITPDRVDYLQRLNIKSGVQTKMLAFDDVTDLSVAKKAVSLLA